MTYPVTMGVVEAHSFPLHPPTYYTPMPDSLQIVTSSLFLAIPVYSTLFFAILTQPLRQADAPAHTSIILPALYSSIVSVSATISGVLGLLEEHSPGIHIAQGVTRQLEFLCSVYYLIYTRRTIT